MALNSRGKSSPAPGLRVGIFHTAFLGDVVLAGLLVDALHKSGHQVFFFTKSPATQIFENDSRVRASIAVKKPKGVWAKAKAIFTMARQVRHMRLHVLLVPHKSFTSTLVAWLSGTPCRIGFNTAAGSFLYSKRKTFLKDQHECLRLLNLVAQETQLVPQDIFDACHQLARPILKPTLMARRAFEEKFEDLLKRLGTYVVVAPGSVWATKKYHPEKWAEVIFALLKDDSHINIVLSGSGHDLIDIKDVKHIFHTLIQGEYAHLRTRLFDVGGLFDLAEFALMISKSAGVLANDSSPVHFASAFAKPIAAVFGPTVEKFGFGPTSPQSALVCYDTQYHEPLHCRPCSKHGSAVCPQKHHRCMKDLDAAVVAQGFQRVYNNDVPH